MAAPRKTFRIEETAAAWVARRAEAFIAPSHMPPPALGPNGDTARVGEELSAVTRGAAEATQRILAAAEEIDQLAAHLAVTLKGRAEQDTALDISEAVIRIFEACNFQDLIGQRIGNALKTLRSKDAALGEEAERYLHGPRRDDEDGHMTQAEIDELFGF